MNSRRSRNPSPETGCPKNIWIREVKNQEKPRSGLMNPLLAMSRYVPLCAQSRFLLVDF